MILKILRLAPSRYHAWRRAAEGCGLEDRPSCPRTMPNQLAAEEIATIKDMVLDMNLRHMPLRTLSLYAQRVGKVWASVSTWARLLRERGWRRPRFRVHPEKPTVGIRATRPNELWHIDVSILKLLDGRKAYVHAVIDNWSRKILAWAVAESLNPATTCEVLVAAGRHLKQPGAEPEGDAPKTAGIAIVGAQPDGPIVYSDSGVENVNHLVAATLLTEGLRLVLVRSR